MWRDRRPRENFADTMEPGQGAVQSFTANYEQPTQEGWFVEHPNILFGQRMLLGRRPSSPFVEFREAAAAFKGHK